MQKRDAALGKILCQEIRQHGDLKEIRVLYECGSTLFVSITRIAPGKRVEVSRAATLDDHLRATQALIEQQDASIIH